VVARWDTDRVLDAPHHSGVNNSDIFTIGVDGTGLRNVTNTPSLREDAPDWGSS